MRVIRGDACSRILISALPLIDPANVLLLLTPLLRVTSRTSSPGRQSAEKDHGDFVSSRGRFSRDDTMPYAALTDGRRYCSHFKCHARADAVHVVSSGEIIFVRYRAAAVTVAHSRECKSRSWRVARSIVNSWKIYSSPSDANTRTELYK